MTTIDTSKTYILTNQYFGSVKALAVSKSNSSLLILETATRDNAPNHQWFQTTDSVSPFYRLHNIWGGVNMALDVINDAGTGSTGLHMTHNGNYSGQQWRFDRWRSGSEFRLSNKFTGPDIHLGVDSNTLKPRLGLGDHSRQRWMLKAVGPERSSISTFAATTAPVTTAPMTTAPVTTAPMTTAPVTTAPATTAPMTTALMTTAPATTAPVTTALVTTAPVTTAPVNIQRLGFSRLGKDGARDGSHCINVIFVHGLRGHPKRTWGGDISGEDDHIGTDASTSKEQSKKSVFRLSRKASSLKNREVSSGPSSRKPFWPDEFLSEDVPEARVWTYGYNANVIGGLFQANNQNSISHHGRDLYVKLQRDLEDKQDPIIFIAHSLGGIIVKDAISRSETCRLRTKLIIFLGTPHRGSQNASWGEIASNLAALALQDTNKKIIKTLAVNSELLDYIHESFIDKVHDIKIHSFQEARGISGLKGLNGKVVDDFSSKLGLQQVIETVESIDADHMQMTKFANKEDAGYRAIIGVLKQFIRSGLQNDVDTGSSSTLPTDRQQMGATAEELGAATSR